MIQKIETLRTLIEKNSKFLLINHIRMDPDAFWSLAGFYFLLKKLNKQVKAINDEATPKDFSFLTSENIIEPNLNIQEFNPDIIISFDAASLDQLGKSYADNTKIFAEKPFVVIDHHATNPSFWKINFIDIKASSSAEIVYTIIKTLWYENLIDENIATLLLAGIHADTNTFYNKNTTSYTLEVAGKLLDLKARNKEIIFEFFRKKSLKKIQLWWKMMQEVKQENGITYSSVPYEWYKDSTDWDQLLKWFANEMLANIKWTQVALFLYELQDKSVKASFRSNRDDIDVAQLCTEFWGGWHKLAAWFTSQENIKTLENILIQKLKEIL